MNDVASAQSSSVPPEASAGKGLRSGAIGLWQGAAWGFNGCAPANGLAVLLGLIAPWAGVKTPAIILCSFGVMFITQVAFMWLTRYYPDCGQSFTWVTRVMRPYVGWVYGFVVFMMGVIFFPNSLSVTVAYAYDLVGLQSAAASTAWVIIGGLAVVAVIVFVFGVRGIEISTVAAVILMLLQTAAIVLLSVIIIIKIYGSSPEGSVKLSLSMLSPFGLSWSSFASAMLLGMFFFIGWDVTASLSEEAKGSRTAALSLGMSTVILMIVLVLGSSAATAYHGSGFLADNYADTLAALARDALGSPWDKIVVAAVVASTFAGMLAMLAIGARLALSMAVFKAFPRVFGDMRSRWARKYQSPAVAVLIFGAIVTVAFVVETAVDKNLVWDLVASFALLAPLSYLLPCLCCPVLMRARLTESVWNFVTMLVIPIVAAAILGAVSVRSVIDYAKPENSFTGGLFGIGTPVLIAGGTIIVGIVLAVIWRFARPQFFTESVEELGMTAPELMLEDV